MRARLIDAGVPAARILIEIDSLTTRDQALNLPDTLRARRIHSFVLVTSAVHMPRAAAALQAVGMDPIPSSAVDPFVSANRWSVMPSRAALRLSRMAIYEYGAVAYYWSRGWFTPSDVGRVFRPGSPAGLNSAD